MATLKWEGLEELKAALRQLPAELTGQAAKIVEAAANRAEADARLNYPVGKTGNLRDGMGQIERDDSANFGYRITVINKAPHAWIYEYGTQARHRGLKTWRPMPVGNVFVPAMERNRRWMYDQFRALLREQGLGVTGDF